VLVAPAPTALQECPSVRSELGAELLMRLALATALFAAFVVRLVVATAGPRRVLIMRSL
jgi:hypothetical protein